MTPAVSPTPSRANALTSLLRADTRWRAARERALQEAHAAATERAAAIETAIRAGISQCEVARLLGRHHSTIQEALQRACAEPQSNAGNGGGDQ